MPTTAGGSEQSAATHTTPLQQSEVAPQEPPSAMHWPAGGSAWQCRVAGLLIGVSSRQAAVFFAPVPPQQSSSTSQLASVLLPTGWQASIAQNARSLM